MSLSLLTESRDASAAFGRGLGRRLSPGDVVLLHGNLGSGKTTVAQGILAGLGVTGSTPSPTFTLINEYLGRTADGRTVPVHHLDLYRLRDAADLDGIGLDDYLAPRDAITLIEWPERAAARLDGEYLLIELTMAGDDRRRLRVSPLPVDTLRFAWLEQFDYEECDPNSR
jgi:tRNA threonylcarbamoyladenosine biosynthesis protein TsaE